MQYFHEAGIIPSRRLLVFSPFLDSGWGEIIYPESSLSQHSADDF